MSEVTKRDAAGAQSVLAELKGTSHRTRVALTREWLIENYSVLRRPTTDIAADAGVAVATLYSFLTRFGIERRGQDRGVVTRLEVPPSAEYLEREYVTNGRSVREIGRECRCSASTIYNLMREYGIPRATDRPAIRPMATVLTRELLDQRYTQEKSSIQVIARDTHATSRTVLAYMEAHAIDTRRPSRSRTPDLELALAPDRLAAMLESGWSYNRIAREIGCATTTVSQYARAAGLASPGAKQRGAQPR